MRYDKAVNHPSDIINVIIKYFLSRCFRQSGIEIKNNIFNGNEKVHMIFLYQTCGHANTDSGSSTLSEKEE